MTATLEIANADTTETNGHGRRVGEAAAFRARVDERLKNLERDVGGAEVAPQRPAALHRQHRPRPGTAEVVA